MHPATAAACIEQIRWKLTVDEAAAVMALIEIYAAAKAATAEADTEERGCKHKS